MHVSRPPMTTALFPHAPTPPCSSPLAAAGPGLLRLRGDSKLPGNSGRWAETSATTACHTHTRPPAMTHNLQRLQSHTIYSHVPPRTLPYFEKRCPIPCHFRDCAEENRSKPFSLLGQPRSVRGFLLHTARPQQPTQAESSLFLFLFSMRDS